MTSEPIELDGPPHDGLVVANLVAAAAAGDAAAWEAIVDRFSGVVWAIARAHRLNSADAAEVTQSVWFKLAENLERLHEPSSLGAWLAAVTRHECLRRIRETSRAEPVALVVESAWLRSGDDIDAGRAAAALRVALRRAFERLPAQSRSVMRLLAVEPRMSYAEIAAALDIPIGSIGPVRQRCLRQLRTSPEISAFVGMAS